jgi:peptidoglycan/xylan/chitin deacetylase (PgdA/CDA1 family)
MRPALWTVDPQDWRPSATAYQIAQATVSAARPGAVILLHDGGGDRAETIKALPWIIDGLRERGYEFVTLEEMDRVRSRW